MTNRTFNSFSEIGGRVLILLSLVKTPFSLDRIVLVDMFSTFAKRYRCGEGNLHGDNDSSSREIAARRAVTKETIIKLAGKGLVSVRATHNGFFYESNESGIRIAQDMKGPYADEYRSICSIVLSKYKKATDRELMTAFSEITKEGLGNG